MVICRSGDSYCVVYEETKIVRNTNSLVNSLVVGIVPQEAVQVLIHHSADVNARDKNWQTPLHVAAANNALRCAEVIIPMLSSVNVSDRGGRTALHHAALNGHTEVLQGLMHFPIRHVFSVI